MPLKYCYPEEQTRAMFLNSVKFLLDKMYDPCAGLGSTGALLISHNLSASHCCSFSYPRPSLSFHICIRARKERECSPSSSSLSLAKGMRRVWPSKERHSLAVQRDPGLHMKFRKAKRKSHSSTSIIFWPSPVEWLILTYPSTGEPSLPGYVGFHRNCVQAWVRGVHTPGS